MGVRFGGLFISMIQEPKTAKKPFAPDQWRAYKIELVPDNYPVSKPSQLQRKIRRQALKAQLIAEGRPKWIAPLLAWHIERKAFERETIPLKADEVIVGGIGFESSRIKSEKAAALTQLLVSEDIDQAEAALASGFLGMIKNLPDVLPLVALLKQDVAEERVRLPLTSNKSANAAIVSMDLDVISQAERAEEELTADNVRKANAWLKDKGFIVG